MPSLGRSFWPSWQVVVGLLAVLAGAAAFWHFRSQLTPWQQIGGAVLVGLLGLGLLSRLSGRSLFGPILFYDLVRSARRGRHAFLRCAYLTALLCMLFLLYLNWFGHRGGGIDSLWTGQTLRFNELARFAEAFFETFMAVQFVVVGFTTPACVAGAVAEEKERKTLDYLLTSDLQPLEIVLGKLASRLAYLALLVLTGLPVLGLLQFLGGVDPQLVLAGFAATALTMFSLAGLGILNSVLAAKPRTAILLTYAEAILYLAASMALHLLAWGKVPLLDWLHAGNIILALRSLRSAAATGAGPTAVLPTLLRDYALFHGAVTVLCLLTATAVLRAWSRWQASRRSRRSFRITFMPRRRPRVGRQPMVWKELYTEPMFRFGRITMAVVGALLYGLVLLGAFGFLCLFMLGSARGDLAETMNAGVRCIGTPLACLMLLGVALHAASSISAERERQTFDSLLSSPLSNEAILRAKWIGSIASVRRLGWYLGAIGVVGVFTGGLFPLAVPLLLIAWLIYASFLASLGLTFSLFCCSTTRATVWTLVTIVGLTGGHWLCGMWLNLRFASAPTRGNTDHATWIIELQKYALTPPLTLYLLAFDSNEAEGGLHDVDDFWPTYHKWSSGRSAYWRKGLLSCGRLLAASFGLGCYAVAAWVLWAVARQNFTQVTGRMPLPFHLLRPERAHFLRLPDPDQTAKQRGGAR